MSSEKSTKPKIPVLTIVYFVVVIALIIGLNVRTFISERRCSAESRSKDIIKPHAYMNYVPDDAITNGKYLGVIRNGTIFEMSGVSADGVKSGFSEFRAEQLNKDFEKVSLKIVSAAGTDRFYFDSRTTFKFSKSGEPIEVFNTGDTISFAYAKYDGNYKLIFSFIAPDEVQEEAVKVDYTITSDDVIGFAIIDLFALTFFICLYLLVRAMILAKGERAIAPLILVIACIFLAICYLFLTTYLSKAKAAAPVIYLYPEKETSVNVRLALNGELTTSYPVYDSNGGWTVTAYPDGTLVDRSGRKYPFLFWEGEVTIKPDLSHGFCVKGEDTAAFLEKSLNQLGLTETEADAFIMYWLPQMQGNRYNVISFQTSAYENAVSHKIDPEPDTVIVVNMLWYPSNSSVSIKPQTLTGINPSERKGFTVVEWGGEKYRKGIFKVHIT